MSYSWGDPQDLLTIQVDTYRFQITRNLKSALQHLRKPDADMDLWVDAICIDQNAEDNKEKSSQVLLMTEIYRLAIQVFVWLGPASEDSDLIMRFFDEEGRKLYDSLDEGLVDRSILCHGRMCFGQLNERRKRLRSRLFRPEESRLRRSLESLFSRSYWERVWVVQEIFTAKKIHVFCGLASAKYNHVMAILSEFHSGLENSKRRRPLAEKQLKRPRTERPIEKQEDQEERRKQFHTLLRGSPITIAMHHHPSIMTPLKIAQERLCASDRRGPEWLQKMLVGLRHFKSSNPKDKIFSLMGIISPEFQQGDHIVSIDYDLSLFQVSLNLFKFCVLRSRSPDLNIIAASQPNQDSNFPSWLPDFSKDNGMAMWPRLDDENKDDKISTESHALGTKVLLDEGRILSVHARIIAVVTGVTGNEDDPLATDRIALTNRISSSLAIAERAGLPRENIPRSFWQMLAMKENMELKNLPQSLQSFEESLVDWESFEGKEFIQEFRRMSYGRRFATMETTEAVSAMLGAKSAAENLQRQLETLGAMQGR